MELNEAIEIMLSATGCNGKYVSVTVTDFTKAINVILNAMRDEITTSDALKWCLEHRPKGEENDR